MDIEIDLKLNEQYQFRQTYGKEIVAIKELMIKINHTFNVFKLSDEHNKRLVEKYPKK